MHKPLALALALLLLAAAGCATGPDSDEASTDEPGSLTIYSGRNESLIQPLLDRFQQESGIEVKARYGGTAELAATLLEEGPGTPAAVYISQDAGALGALSAAGLLKPLPEALLQQVPARFRSADGDWIGLSGRARVVVYNPERIDEADLPKSLMEVIEPRYRGRFGVAPGNASFQAHMALVRALEGEEALNHLLAGLVANEPLRYPKNTPIVQAVIQGEIDFGLVNHYYLWRALKEDPEAPGRNYFMPTGDASSFINLAGAAMLQESEAARRLLEFLLTDDAQRYFAEETYEYPLTGTVPPSVELPPLDSLVTPEIDYKTLSESLEATLEAIQQSGLIEF